MKCRNEDGLSENGFCFIAARYCTTQFAKICKAFVPEENDEKHSCGDIKYLTAAQADVLDIESIVRCKDFAHYMPEPMGDAMMCYGFANGHWTAPEDFCSCGVRKE